MIRISRLTDYAVALLSLMGDEGKQDLWSASELAQRSNLPLPTASKVLKLMSKSGLIKAQRGVTGGYKLARPITSISVAEVVEAMDGPIAVTDCAEGSLHKDCQIRNTCALRDGWGYVNLDGIDVAGNDRPSPTSCE